MEKQKVNYHLLTPLKYSLLYLWGTFVLFFIGPIKWNVSGIDMIILTLFIIINFTAFLIGYYFVATKKYNKPKQEENIRIYRRVIFWGTTVILYSIIVNINYYSSAMNVDNIFKLFIQGNTGSLYFERLQINDDQEFWPQKITTLLWWLTWFVYPLVFWHGKNLKKSLRIYVYSVMILDVLFWGMLGTSKEIGSLVITYLSIFILKRATNVRKPKKLIDKTKSAKNRQLKNSKIRVFLLIFLFLTVFGIFQMDRMSELDKSIDNAFEYYYTGHKIDTRQTFADIVFPNSMISYTINSLILYMSAGYMGLNYSLNAPFQWSYGLGSSKAFTSYVVQYLNIDSPPNYLVQIDSYFGWKNGQYWSTIFPWIASDISFYFTWVVMLLAGILMAYAVKDVVYNRDQFSVVIFSKLMLFIIYVPSNNQLVQSRSYFIATVVLGLLYLCYKLKFFIRR